MKYRLLRHQSTVEIIVDAIVDALLRVAREAIVRVREGLLQYCKRQVRLSRHQVRPALHLELLFGQLVDQIAWDATAFLLVQAIVDRSVYRRGLALSVGDLSLRTEQTFLHFLADEVLQRLPLSLDRVRVTDLLAADREILPVDLVLLRQLWFQAEELVVPFQARVEDLDLRCQRVQLRKNN